MLYKTFKEKLKFDSVFFFQIGNNILTTAGAIVIATAINNSDSAEITELDLTVSMDYVTYSYTTGRVFKIKIHSQSNCISFLRKFRRINA